MANSSKCGTLNFYISLLNLHPYFLLTESVTNISLVTEPDDWKSLDPSLS